MLEVAIEIRSSKIKVLLQDQSMVRKIKKYMRRNSFLVQSKDFIIAQISKFTKNDIFCSYFAKILTRSTERLFRKTLPDI